MTKGIRMHHVPNGLWATVLFEGGSVEVHKRRTYATRVWEAARISIEPTGDDGQPTEESGLVWKTVAQMQIIIGALQAAHEIAAAWDRDPEAALADLQETEGA